MTTGARFDRELPTILEDLYLGPTPDYRDEVLTAATTTRQRPAWTFPGRWFPMADIASRPAFAPRLPWRTIGVALIVIAVLVALAVAFVGSRQTRLPARFGVAGNGFVAYQSGGDVYAWDSVTGKTTAIVADPTFVDENPLFSRDGTRIAFLRNPAVGTGYDLMVVNADGTGLRAVPGGHIDAAAFDFDWGTDDRSLIVYGDPRLTRLDAVGSAAPVVVSDDLISTGRVGPTGLTLYQPQSLGPDALWSIGLDGNAPKELLRNQGTSCCKEIATPVLGVGGDLSEARYSPDGKTIALVQTDADSLRMYLMNADGSSLRKLTDEPGKWIEAHFAWSPDGKQVAFNRWSQADGSTDWTVRPIGIASVDGGPVRAVGPTPGKNGAEFQWSPDGTRILWQADYGAGASDGAGARPILIDVATGSSTELGFAIDARPTWQRTAR